MKQDVTVELAGGKSRLSSSRAHGEAGFRRSFADDEQRQREFTATAKWLRRTRKKASISSP